MAIKTFIYPIIPSIFQSAYQKMKTGIKHTLAIVALIMAAFTAQAQVKIGSNPTVIEGQSNLEVEASTPNRKVKVDKTSGQLTIQDGTEGVGKILTSDAVGGASWQAPASQDVPAMLAVYKSPNSDQPLGAGGTFTKADFGIKRFDKGTNFNLTTDAFTVPASGTGYYQVSSIYACTPVIQTTGIALYMYVNGTIVRSVCAGDLNGTGSITCYLNAGDVVTFYFQTSFANATIAGASLDIFMISK